MTNKRYEFHAVINSASKGGAYVVFPYDIRKEFNKGRVKVNAYFDGILYTGSIVNMGIKNPDGSICYIIGVLKEIRTKINKDINDTINVVIEPIE